MSTLAWIAVAWGLLLIAASSACTVRPAGGDWVRRFSRNRPAAWVLTAVALAWGTWLLWHTPLGQFDGLKPLLAVLAPVGYLLIVFCMDELLAVRALGTLFILIPAPVLAAIRWHPSTWRLVVVALCYVMATTGIALVLSPYLPRKWGERLAACPGRCRACGVAGLILGGALLILAFTAY